MTSARGPKESPAIDELPQEFRAKTIGRLQRLIDQNLTRLEKEGRTINVRDLPLQTGILLSKHAELSGIAPPQSVHNQQTVIAGIDQQSARLILAGKAPVVPSKPQVDKGYSGKEGNAGSGAGERSPEIPSPPQVKPAPGLPPRFQALVEANQASPLAKTDPFQALKPASPDPTMLP